VIWDSEAPGQARHTAEERWQQGANQALATTSAMFQPWRQNVPRQKVTKTRALDHNSRNGKFAIACSRAGDAEGFRINAPEFATRRILKRGGVALLLAVSLGMSVRAQNPPEDLSKLSVEDLMNVEVTSVSKKEQKVSQTAAAIFVITQEDIRRSGANNIPDLLRMVPGVNVAQVNSNIWAISVRGFDGEFSNKLLVMLDGRIVYLPTFSGTFWDVLDVPLEDVERIEVIRGPGGATWGANAVDGVINIITSKASESQGGMVVAGAGNLDQGFGTLQYGGTAGKSTDYRLFAKYFNQDHLPGLSGPNGGDGWHILRGGFRVDSKLSAKDDLAVTGDIYSSRTGDIGGTVNSITSPAVQAEFSKSNTTGGYVQADWIHRQSERSDTSLQISFDRYRRNDALRETRNTLDLDFAHHFLWGSRQDVVWGVGYRYSSSTTDGNLFFSLNPADLNTQLFSAFVQDEVALIPQRLSLIAGAKIEHNYFTGFGVMPTLRATWALPEHQMVWAAISRALRTPSEIDTASQLTVNGFVPPSGPPVLIRIVGNPAFQNEHEINYEAGYRIQPYDRLSVDFTAYYNSYSQLQTSEPEPSFSETDPPPLHIILPLEYENLMRGETHGVETFATWKISRRWTLTPAYAFEEIHLHLEPSSQDTMSVAGDEGSSPRQWARVGSHVALVHGLAWDVSANFVGRLANPAVASYTRIDSQISWHLREHLSGSLVGQNLAQDHHIEFLNTGGTGFSNYMKRSGYLKLSWRF
jgi:iron complex outermembrane receptor protein